MRHRVKHWKIASCGAICAAAFNLSASGQAPIGAASDQAAMQALDLLNSGKLDQAAAAYQSLIQRFPNSGDVPEAWFRLADIDYMQGQYDDAISTLGHINQQAASVEIKSAADELKPEILAAKASKMAPGDPGRKEAYEQAIQGYDDYIKKYPHNSDIETANYGRAVAAYQSEDYAAAEQSLRDNLKRFPNSESSLDTQDLLAVVLTAEAAKTLRAHGDKAQAMKEFNEAITLLANIILRHSDVALANDAQFQIGEVLFNRGNAQEGAARDKDLANAIDAYHAVLPKEQMVQAQQDRINLLLERLRQAVLRGDRATAQALQRLQDRENTKLQALKDAPDQTLNAQLRIAACYFLLQRYDESRVLLHYIQGFATDAFQKKQIAYYLVLTYASQGIMDSAESAYALFQSAYKGDPIGENLPLMMGTGFLKANQPDKATKYLDEEATLYPNSPLVNEALGQEASALIGLKRYDQALDTYNKYLKTNPSAPLAAHAEMGIAQVYQSTNRIPEAIKQYQKVADTYPGTQDAEDSSFYAAGLETSIDPKKAISDLQAFIKKFPDSQFADRSMMMVAQMQAATGDIPGAVATYKEIPEKYPKSEFAPQSYFQRAIILSKENKTDEMVALMKEFTTKFPDDKNIYYAYDTIAQSQVTKGNIPDAIATYTGMVDTHPKDPMAPSALYHVAELWRKQADSLGQYQGISEAQRTEWKKDIDNSIAAVEKLLNDYSDSGQVGVALKTLLADQQMYLAAGLKTPEVIDSYFHSLAGKFASNPSARSRILFTAAIFIYEKDPQKAITDMNQAYKPDLVYAPADLDIYGAALIDQGKTRQAYDIYAKIAHDYPIPAGQQPSQASPAIQEAQATATFGMAQALAKEGKTADAAKLFAQLKANYPWSPKVVEASYGIAKSDFEDKKYDDAMKLLVPIIASRNAPATLRAHALLLDGDVWAAKGNLDAAIDSYLKTSAFYGGVSDAAAEADWKGGQALEKQAAMLNEQSTPKRSEQIAKAVAAYQEIVDKFSNSKYLQQAQDRLNALKSR
ncbi:MAG TPA: tetratricopeptide repeat protein [Chthoniobacteraceae bacterium]|jgi:TolA-binding protein|nr:tetratricopeptide repeat protein [Chthoniobacteraceae bacterium]